MLFVCAQNIGPSVLSGYNKWDSMKCSHTGWSPGAFLLKWKQSSSDLIWKNQKVPSYLALA